MESTGGSPSRSSFREIVESDESAPEGKTSKSKISSSVAGSTSSVTTVRRSNTNSPKRSRESSPSRSGKPSTAVRARPSRRKTGPSLTPDQASLFGSSDNTPSASPPPSLQIRTVIEQVLGEPRTRPGGKAVVADDVSRWPKPSRLKSPPPSASSAQAALLSGQSSSTPSVVIQRPHPSPAVSPLSQVTEPESSGQLIPSSMRPPARAPGVIGLPLETVQESSVPSTPAVDPISPHYRLGEQEEHRKPSEGPGDDEATSERKGRTESSSESGTDKGGNNGTKRRPPTVHTSAPITRPNTLAPSAAYSALNSKSKTGAEASVQSMTVETETVSSVPQVAVGGGAGERGGSMRVDPTGSVRLRPSMETLKPKKDKRRMMRKTPSLISGAGSSRADVFEAKVASAVGEANPSDSEETFVYESNPPEPPMHRPGRHHSRTPSTTSIHSQLDHRGALLANHNLVGKRSMKFVSNASYIGTEPEHEIAVGLDSPGLGRGSGRGGGPATSHHSHHHHHIGHWGHSGRGGHPTLFENGSPFTHSPKASRMGMTNTSRQSSRATSPRNLHHNRLGSTAAKKFGHISTYDLDVEGADDERTPLMSSSHAGRRRTVGSASFREDYAPTRWRNLLTRLTGFLILTIIILSVIAGALAFFLATTKPLRDVRVDEIQNVLASKQEIMLDLLVEAINPNVVAVTIWDMDVNVFAKSRHVADEGLRKDKEPRTNRQRERPEVSTTESQRPNTSRSRHSTSQDSDADCRARDGVDEGTDPMPDPAEDSHTMLLGRIFQFDSPPTFDGSPLAHQASSAIGEVRLAQPGNKTEEGGTARWESVIQHPFELIVRGVLKYKLPLSNRVRTAPIGASVLVHPEEGVDETGRMYVVPVRDAPYAPGSNVISHKSGQRFP
ncbi:MAG: hypothetical protein M1816_006475 [Peltula sp. TS41687]|nr:MAG: hypothetical protein M1816_006475 [Peltula sp. TS41687]